MASIAYDLHYLWTGLEVLETYLHSAELFWPIGIAPPAGEPPYPQLTLGSLILARKRAEARKQTAAQQAELAEVANKLDSSHSRWFVTWGRKSAVEYRARLTLWKNFLNDYRQQPEAHYDRYAYEVNRRVLLELLMPDAKMAIQEDRLLDAEIELLDGLDHYLRSVLLPGVFVWESELMPAFPPDPFWYLYRRLGKV